MQSQTKWPTFSQLKHLASVEFKIAVLTNGLKVAEVVYTKVVIEARFRVTVETEVFIIKTDISVLAVIAAIVYTLLHLNCSLCKCFKSLSASPARSQKN